MPVPLDERETGTRTHVLNAPELVWRTAPDSRVDRFFEAQFLHSTIGAISIDVDEIDTNPPQLGADESYTLLVDEREITLRSRTTWGAIRGLATLYQLEEFEQLHRCWRIEDQPRFAWRGLLLDAARHFLPVAELRKVVDGLAVLKMNTLHLHLSDDQGFRFPSETSPRLVSEEHYTAGELVALVEYAADRGVRIVPELDVPGHVTSWLVGYPELGFGGGQPSLRFGVHEACLDPTNEIVYAVLTKLLAEVAGVFPDRFIHLGGDEVHPARWEAEPAVLAYMAEHGIEDVSALQARFNQRVFDIVGSMGREVIAWDEVLHPDMPGCVVQNWRGATTRDRTRVLGLDSIVSSGYYLDLFFPADVHYAFDPELDQRELLALEDAMRADIRFEHVAAGMAWTDQWREGQIELDAVEAEAPVGRILGGEACLWGELVDADTLPIRLWSRLPAVAERLWSTAQKCETESFYRRLPDVLELAEFRWRGVQTRGFEQAGLEVDQIGLASCFEPVKWYARLLGEDALAARLEGREMPQARPYDASTSLRRVVDFLAPESLPARRLAGSTVDELRERAQEWALQKPRRWPEDMRPAVAALREVGEAVSSYLSGETSPGDDPEARILGLYGPHGEYMLAVVPPLLEWLRRAR
jgi:hexosaminidase